jgi:tRNA 2-selenouridine synthase
MRINYITVEEALTQDKFQFVDVRSPKEFHEASIPGAINIPLLNDHERELIGTIYCQFSPEQARLAGINLVTPKIPQLISSISKIQEPNKIIFYCWRGGLRSQSMAKLCLENGLEILVLKGGYKAYRRQVNFYWNKPFLQKVVMLHGLSGVGKTCLLNQLAEMGITTVDLEGLANNRGSVFGQIHGGVQPSQKDFEAVFFNICSKLDNTELIVVECENKRIGDVHIPKNFDIAMKSGYKIHLYADLEARIKRIIEDYGYVEISVLKEKIILFTKRLGKKRVSQIVELLEQRQLAEVVRILLVEYYDPMYGYQSAYDKRYDLSVNCNDMDAAAKIIYRYIKQDIKQVKRG